MFRKYHLDLDPYSLSPSSATKESHVGQNGGERYVSSSAIADNTIFWHVYSSIRWDNVTRGRQGANLVNVDRDPETGTEYVPIVRTTTAYHEQMQHFSVPVDYIQKCINAKVAADSSGDATPMSFNNVMAEVYTDECRNMKFHSDQALDLDPETYIAVFSCYDDPSAPPRALRIIHKDSDPEDPQSYQDISMDHQSVIVFSVETNKFYRHKIIQETSETGSRWLGLTFRCSATFVYRADGSASEHTAHTRFRDTGKLLELADKEKKQKFIRYKGRENREAFEYPSGICYTLSPHDFWPPINPPG